MAILTTFATSQVSMFVRLRPLSSFCFHGASQIPGPVIVVSYFTDVDCVNTVFHKRRIEVLISQLMLNESGGRKRRNDFVLKISVRT